MCQKYTTKHGPQKRKSPKKEYPPPPFLRLRSLRKDQEKGRSSRKGDYTLCSHNISQSIGILEILESHIPKVEGCKSGMALPRAGSHDVKEWDSTLKGPGRSLCPDIMSLDTMKRCILCGTVLKGEMDYVFNPIRNRLGSDITLF